MFVMHVTPVAKLVTILDEDEAINILKAKCGTLLSFACHPPHSSWFQCAAFMTFAPVRGGEIQQTSPLTVTPFTVTLHLQ